jgi:hypothetical protein
MFEIVDRRPRARRRLACVVRDALDLDRCELLTRRQRLTRAALWIALGAAAALAAVVHVERAFSAPMQPLEPELIHDGERVSGLRFRFEHGWVEASCQVVIFWEVRKWTVKC